MNLLDDTIDFDAYFADQTDEAAHVKPASSWADAVVDRLYGTGAPTNWTPTGFAKTADKFDLRPGELTIWAGINGHGKTTLLSLLLRFYPAPPGSIRIDGVALDAIHTAFSDAYGPGAGNTGWYAMDVEFKFDDESNPGQAAALYIKQARPYPGRGQ